MRHAQIARTFHRRGIFEEWGSGTLKMADLAISSGLPPPESDDTTGWVTVCFRSRPRIGTAPAFHQRAMLTLLARSEDGLTRQEMRVRLGHTLSDRQLRRTLEKLRDSGLILSVGRGASARWKRTHRG